MKNKRSKFENVSKEHYCYNIYATVFAPSPLPSLDDPPCICASLDFYKKILIPPFMIFQKSQPINKGCSHYEIYEPCFFNLKLPFLP